MQKKQNYKNISKESSYSKAHDAIFFRLCQRCTEFGECQGCEIQEQILAWLTVKGFEAFKEHTNNSGIGVKILTTVEKEN